MLGACLIQVGGPASLVLGLIGMARDRQTAWALIGVLIGGALTVLMAPALIFGLVQLCR